MWLRPECTDGVREREFNISEKVIKEDHQHGPLDQMTPAERAQHDDRAEMVVDADVKHSKDTHGCKVNVIGADGSA